MTESFFEFCIFCCFVDYVDTLQELLEEVVDNPRPFQEMRDAIEVPPALSAEYERPDAEAALSRWSRFAAEP